MISEHVTIAVVKQEFTPSHFAVGVEEVGEVDNKDYSCNYSTTCVDVGWFFHLVVHDGTALELTMSWPSPTVNLKLMYKKWLRISSANYKFYHL